MAKLTGSRPTLNTDGSPAGFSSIQAQIRDGSGGVVKEGGEGTQAAGNSFSVSIPLTVAEASIANSARARAAYTDGSVGPWEDRPAPAGGFTPSIPGPVADLVVSNA